MQRGINRPLLDGLTIGSPTRNFAGDLNVFGTSSFSNTAVFGGTTVFNQSFFTQANLVPATLGVGAASQIGNAIFPPVTTVNALGGQTIYFTSNVGGNWGLNFTGSTPQATLANTLQVGQVLPITVIVQQGSSQFVANTYTHQIDGQWVYPRWTNGYASSATTAPVSTQVGNNQISVYEYQIIKVANPTANNPAPFVMLAGMRNYY